MQNTIQIRFIATNYYNLQGLRMVPLGALLVFVCLWANGLEYPARDFLLPAGAIVVAGLLALAADRYYLSTYGRVQRTIESHRLEWLVCAVFGGLALAAFILDVSNHFPLSLLGLVFAAGLLVDYIRTTWLVRGRFLLYYPIGAVLVAVLSVLPLIGLPEWWLQVGIRDQLVAIAVVIGIFIIIAGLWGHLFLARTLPARLENNHEHAV